MARPMATKSIRSASTPGREGRDLLAVVMNSARRIRAYPQLWIGGIILLLLIISAVFAPIIAPYNPTDVGVGPRLGGPSFDHLFGTDRLGRDAFSRVLHGGRLSLVVASSAVAIGMVIGVALGLLSGFQGGRVDSLIMRIMDGFLAFPDLILALTIGFALGPSVSTVILALAVVRIPSFARVVRGQTLSARNYDYVLAAETIGAPPFRIAVRHVLPNLASIILVQVSLGAGAVIFAEASLSFLGLGVPPPAPSWGGMLRDGYSFIEINPWLPIIPGAVIFLAVLAFNFVGDGLRDMLDPQQRQNRNG